VDHHHAPPAPVRVSYKVRKEVKIVPTEKSLQRKINSPLAKFVEDFVGKKPLIVAPEILPPSVRTDSGLRKESPKHKIIKILLILPQKAL